MNELDQNVLWEEVYGCDTQKRGGVVEGTTLGLDEVTKNGGLQGYDQVEWTPLHTTVLTIRFMPVCENAKIKKNSVNE